MQLIFTDLKMGDKVISTTGQIWMVLTLCRGTKSVTLRNYLTKATHTMSDYGFNRQCYRRHKEGARR